MILAQYLKDTTAQLFSRAPLPSFQFHRYLNMLYTRLSLALAFARFSDAFFRISCPGRIVRERLDPVVNAGKISGHVHTISGGSGFAAAMSYEDARASKCSSCPIKVRFVSSIPIYTNSILHRKISPTTGPPNSTCT
jgi:hypothetical protein